MRSPSAGHAGANRKDQQENDEHSGKVSDQQAAVTCRYEPCSKEFVPPPRKKRGGRIRVYCCDACRHAANGDRRANESNRARRTFPQPAVTIPEPHPAPQNASATLSAEIDDDDDMWKTPDAAPFDWCGSNVIVESQSPVAVYVNDSGGLVIRQEAPCSMLGQEDSCVIVNAESLRPFIAKLIQIVREADDRAD